MQNAVKQGKPYVELRGAHIACLHMNLLRIAVIGAFMQDRIGPETRDLVFMRGPSVDMRR